jgi:hypothetical protein
LRHSRRPCHQIQEDIASNRGLSQEDHQHVLSCRACSDVAAKVAELDVLVRKVVDQEIPSDFADRVMAGISQEESRSQNIVTQWLPLLERIFYSKAVQWFLVGMGSVFGLFKIFRFFSAVLVRAFI